MNEVLLNESAISVLVNDFNKADELYDNFLTITDNEGFADDRRIFQEFINKGGKFSEKLLFNYGFAWQSFDRVEAGFLIEDKKAPNVFQGYSIIVDVTLQDDLSLNGGLLLVEKFEDETFRYLKIAGEGFVTSRQYFELAFDEMIQVYSNYLAKVKSKMIQTYEKARSRILLEKEIDEIIGNSHLALLIQNEVRKSINPKSNKEIRLLELAREFSKVGNRLFEYQGNRYFEVAGRLLFK